MDASRISHATASSTEYSYFWYFWFIEARGPWGKMA
jgi:hypothetical protein